MTTRSEDTVWTLVEGDSPVVAAAIHDGLHVRGEVRQWIEIDAAARRREEDPFTARWTDIAPTRIIGGRSRFEVDLNRPRDKAVYLSPEDAWGLRVWKGPPPADMVERSRRLHDAFYAQVEGLLATVAARFGRFFVYDLHSYNHRREGPHAPPAPSRENPEVNIGTGSVNRAIWGPLVDRLIEELRSVDFLGRRLDVRENVRFFGGAFPRWIHERFPLSGCAVAIEFKKTFMDEWTGEPNLAHIDEIRTALASTVPGVLEELEKLWTSQDLTSPATA